MTLNEYQTKSQEFDLTSKRGEDIWQKHALFQFTEEVGELMGVFKRALRGDECYQNQSDVYEKLESELGDCFWGLAAVCASHGLSLEYIATKNLEKLEDRRNRGVIQGKGDAR